MNTLNLERRDALLADIKLANNGYLIMSYMNEPQKDFTREIAQTGEVVITNGLVHMPSTKPEFFKTPYPVKAFKPSDDGADYEGAILSRQAIEGLYD